VGISELLSLILLKAKHEILYYNKFLIRIKYLQVKIFERKKETKHCSYDIYFDALIVRNHVKLASEIYIVTYWVSF
jgi:hypothetical protein